MSKKKPVERRYAPAPGADSDFDEQDQKVWEALEASGNPEGVTREVARETLAKRMVEFGGKTYTVDDIGLPDEDDDEPYVPPTELSILPPATEPYWYESPEDTRLIDWYVMSRRTQGNAFHGALLITGPAGSGKTMGVPQAIARINAKHGLAMKLLKMDCATITDPQKWLGRREIDHEGSHYIESDFIRACREGDAILLDEITRVQPMIGNMIHSLLDGSQSLHLSELNMTIAVHPQTVWFATANIGAQFGGTHRFDWALRERFAYTIERDFPPVDDEIRILTSWTNCDPDGARVLVDIAQKTRSMYLTGDLRSPISTRTLVNAARLVASGASEREALSVTALPLFDGDANGSMGEKSERAQVMATIDLRA